MTDYSLFLFSFFSFFGSKGNGFSGSIIEMILNAGVMAKAVLLILLGFSILSWAIIGYKAKLLRRVRQESERFLDLYDEAKSLSAIHSAGKRMDQSPLAKVFVAGYTEGIRKIRSSSFPDPGKPNREFLEEEIRKTLSRAVHREVNHLERALNFLATTGSTTPFIGLFGTVWGVMNAFRGIGVRGSANIGVVAPGISEALIATAAGLAAAIPAVIAYNFFLHRIKVIAAEVESFSGEVSSRLVRELEQDYGKEK